MDILIHKPGILDMNYRKLQRIHNQLIRDEHFFRDDRSSEKTPVKFKNDVQSYIDLVRENSISIVDLEERNSLNANLRYWAGVIFEIAGEYPNIELAPPKAAGLFKELYSSGKIFLISAIVIFIIAIFFQLISVIVAPFFSPLIPVQLSETSTITSTATLTSTPSSTLTPSSTPTPTFNPSATPIGTPLIWPPEAISKDNAERIGEVSRIGKGRVYSSDVSHDEKTLAVGTSLGVYIYDLNNLSELRFIPTDYFVKSLSFSPDNNLLAAGMDTGHLEIWDYKKGILLHSVRAHSDDILSVEFSPDGSLLATASLDHTIKLWDTSSFNVILPEMSHEKAVDIIEFSHDGKLIASGSLDHSIVLWDVETKKSLLTLEGHKERILTIKYSPGDHLLYSGSEDDTIKVWTLENGELFDSINIHTADVEQLVLSADGKILVSATSNGELSAWQRQGLVYPISSNPTAHIGRIVSLHFINKESSLLSIGEDGYIRIWDSVWEPERAFETPEKESLMFRAWAWSVSFSDNGRLMAAPILADEINLFAIPSGSIIQYFHGIGSETTDVVISPDGKVTAAALDYNIFLFNAENGDRSIFTIDELITQIAFVPGKQLISAATWDSSIYMWKYSNGIEEILKVKAPDRLSSLAVSQDGNYIAGGSLGIVYIWSTVDGEMVKTLFPVITKEWIQHLAFSPDGKLLSIVTYSGLAMVHDISRGVIKYSFPNNYTKEFEGDSFGEYKVATFSPDGSLIATATKNRVVQLWDTRNGNLLKTLEGHREWVNFVAFSPDSLLLASVSGDGTLRFWGVVTQ